MRHAVILATLPVSYSRSGASPPPGKTRSRPARKTETRRNPRFLRPGGPGRTTPEATAPETTVPEDVGKSDEGTVEATVVVSEEPKEPGKGDSGAGNYGRIQVDNGIEEAGQPAGKPG